MSQLSVIVNRKGLPLRDVVSNFFYLTPTVKTIGYMSVVAMRLLRFEEVE